MANMPGQQIPNSCFTIEGEDMEAAHMEFFLSATISPSMDGAQVYEIALLADDVVVAKAVYDEEDDNG